ncbi:MAG TPA: hypothetical protein VJ826_07240, partial [Candidatus Polarisedimenticolaceae bacterium]|nr:hypothetical protein [Candidatus Polarisedimenticolaceae bacterium]
MPAEGSGLGIGKVSGAPAAAVVSWGSLAAQSGTATRYDELTGALGALRSAGGFSGASCLANDVTATAMTSTQAWPPTSTSLGYWYLVRGQNACGRGTYG